MPLIDAVAIAAGALLISGYTIDPEIGDGIVIRVLAILALAGTGVTSPSPNELGEEMPNSVTTLCRWLALAGT